MTQHVAMVTETGGEGSVLPAADRGELDDMTLARARAGDDVALTALVVRYQRRVHALVSRILAGRPQMIDDVAQEAFVKVLLGLPRFDARGPARLSTWILTVVTRVCIDVLRTKPPASEEIPASLAASSDPEGETAGRQLGRRVEAAMAVLAEDMRAVIVLRAYHDFDYDEIAAALGIEVGTVKSRLARARIALRDVLEGAP